MLKLLKTRPPSARFPTPTPLRGQLTRPPVLHAAAAMSHPKAHSWGENDTQRYAETHPPAGARVAHVPAHTTALAKPFGPAPLGCSSARPHHARPTVGPRSGVCPALGPRERGRLVRVTGAIARAGGVPAPSALPSNSSVPPGTHRRQPAKPGPAKPREARQCPGSGRAFPRGPARCQPLQRAPTAETIWEFCLVPACHRPEAAIARPGGCSSAPGSSPEPATAMAPLLPTLVAAPAPHGTSSGTAPA